MAAVWVRVAGLMALPAAAAAQGVPVLNGGAFITPAKVAEAAALCPAGAGYPGQVVWSPALTVNKPAPATKGTPKIEQYRAGTLIATYTTFTDQPGCTYKLDGTDNINPAPAAASGCGPFTHVKGWRLWQTNDVFKVYPAVYKGIYNDFAVSLEFDQPSDYPANPVTPTGLVIEGVVQKGVRPVVLLDGPSPHNALYQSAVYFGNSVGITMENIDVMEAPGGSAGEAGIYVNGARNLTLRNVRISGFQQSLNNGIFGADGNSGTLTLDQVELDHNGGNSSTGLAHNAYINASSADPNFSLVVTHSWSHDALAGHLFKTRAVTDTFIGNYFQGGLPQPGQTVAESYLLDVPNGGALTVRDNVFAKNAAGYYGNGASMTFAVEGVPDSRTLSLDIENNTFVSWTLYYDGVDVNWPFFFYNPAVQPGTPQWPSAVPYRVIKNAFVGYCPSPGNALTSYRGDIYAEEAFSELSGGFSLLTKVDSNEKLLAKTLPAYKKILGTPVYAHAEQADHVRKLTTLGAQD